MGAPDDPDQEDPSVDLQPVDADGADVLRRRALFVARALGGLALPALVGGCGDPQPCLNIAQPRELVPTATASSTASSEPAASSASTNAPVADGTFSITAAEAQKLGLPALGFRAAMKRGGWTISGPTKDQYVRASGPPGGPLTFLAKPYHDGDSDKLAIGALFKQALSDWSGLDPIDAARAETVTFGGRRLEAQAFRTGKGPTTTIWCVIQAPSGPGARAGILFLLGAGAGESTKPSCKASLEHPALAEIVQTLSFDP